MSLWRKRNKEKPQIIQAILPMPNSDDWSRRVGSDILKDFADECGAAFEFAKNRDANYLWLKAKQDLCQLWVYKTDNGVIRDGGFGTNCGDFYFF